MDARNWLDYDPFLYKVLLQTVVLTALGKGQLNGDQMDVEWL